MAFSHSCVLDAVSASILVTPSKAILPIEFRPWDPSPATAALGRKLESTCWGQVSFSSVFITKKKLLEVTLKSLIKAQSIVIKLDSGLQWPLPFTHWTPPAVEWFLDFSPSSSTSYTSYSAGAWSFLPAHTATTETNQNVPQWLSPNLKPMLCST